MKVHLQGEELHVAAENAFEVFFLKRAFGFEPDGMEPAMIMRLGVDAHLDFDQAQGLPCLIIRRVETDLDAVLAEKIGR